MSGSIVDLASPNIQLPSQIVVDTNLIVARLLAAHQTPHPETAARANQFFDLLEAMGSVGLVTSVSCQETFHVAIRAKFRMALSTHQAELAAALPQKRRYDWLDLSKVRP